MSDIHWAGNLQPTPDKAATTSKPKKGQTNMKSFVTYWYLV